MSSKVLLQTYIKQGKAYKKMLETVNTNGNYTSKIKIIDNNLKAAKKKLKAI